LEAYDGVVKILIGGMAGLIIVAGAFGQRMPEPQLYAAGLPVYPPIARAARIQGDVKLEFVLNQSGEPISVDVLSGPPMLTGAAEENVKTWRFHLPKDLFRTEWRYQTTFRFKFSDGDAYEDSDYAGNPHLTVVLDSYRLVEVITKPPSDKSAQGKFGFLRRFAKVTSLNFRVQDAMAPVRSIRSEFQKGVMWRGKAKHLFQTRRNNTPKSPPKRHTFCCKVSSPKNSGAFVTLTVRVSLTAQPQESVLRLMDKRKPFPITPTRHLNC